MIPNFLNKDRYQIIRTLASGGFGDTFLAEDTQMPSHRPCVIKQLKPVTINPQIYQLVQDRFKREAAILEQLGEENRQIPRLYAYFTEGGKFYLVQEWIEGETLTNKVTQSGQFNENEVKEILLNILPVLSYVHSQNIIHRDIKPDNIILRKKDNQPVLIDFGAVRETMGTVVTTGGNTTSSIVIGTPGFMPAEQSTGRPVYSSDLYSLGLTAIYLLTGKNPQELDTDIHTGEILWQQYASVSLALATVLDKAICYHPRDRFSTAQAMLAALQSSATPLTPTAVSLPPTIPDQTLAATQSSPVISSAITPTSNNGLSDFQKTLVTGTVIGAFVFVGLIMSRPQTQPTTQVLSSPTPSPTFTPTTPPQPTTQVLSSPTPSPTFTPTTPQPQRIPVPKKQLYRIINVANNDVLYVHSGPGVRTTEIGSIPPNGTDIEIIGSRVLVKTSIWVPVRYRGLTGWVNSKFLGKQ